MKKSNPLLTFILSFIFILLGVRLISNKDQFSIVIGYISIVFWSALFFVTLYKLIIKKKI